MKRSHAKIAMFLVLLTSVILLSANASAQIAPYLFFSEGNYSYDVGTKVLSFDTNVAGSLVQYTDGEYGYDDPIIGKKFIFGQLMNSESNNLIFGPSPGGATGPVYFSIDGFITAKLDGFIVQDSSLNWGTLYDIQTVDGAPYSQYVAELLANGGGLGNISIDFRTSVGDPVDFTISSNGYVGGMVAAPEPISAILFVTGGATLAIRSYRKKRI